MAICDQIRLYRKKNRLTQSQLAEQLGVSPQAISKWETGTGYPDLSLIVPLAMALNISTDELFEYRDGLNLNIIKSEWNSMAAAYELFNNNPDSYSYQIEWPCIQSILPDLHEKTVLDIGCGTGIFTFLLEQYAPAKIIGMDLSEGMLAIAAEKACEKKSRAHFLCGDANHLASYFNETFDFIFSSTTTQYLACLDTLFADIGRLLHKDGTCILSIIHPVYSAQYPIEHGNTFPSEQEWVVRYLDLRKRAYIQPWIEYNDQFENRLSRSYHYTFSNYINAIGKAGFQIDTLLEPMPPESWKNTSPSRYESYLETPVFLILKLTKGRKPAP